MLGDRVTERTPLAREQRPDLGVEIVDCNEVLEQLGDFLDEGARAELCRAIEAHLSRCRDCQLSVDTVRKTITLYQSDRDLQLPAAFSSRLQMALAREYGEEANSAR